MINIQKLVKANKKIALLFVVLFTNTALGEPSRSQLVIHSRIQHRSSKSCGIPNHPPSVLSPKFVGHTFVNKTMRIGRSAFRHTIKLDFRASSPKSLKPEKHFDKNGLLSILSKINTTNNPESKKDFEFTNGKISAGTVIIWGTKPVQHSRMLANMVTVKPWWKRGKR